jgi:hypothetical protein
MCCTLEVELVAFHGDLQVWDRRKSLQDADWIFYSAQLLECVGGAAAAPEVEGREKEAVWPVCGDFRLDFLFGL